MTNKLPEAFIEKLSKIYSKDDLEICMKGFETEKRKTVFRINTLKTDIDTVINILEENNLKISEIDFLENAFILENGKEKDLWDLDIFEKGYIYMQSLSSQIPVNITDIKENSKVLDITAAPGGKTSQCAIKMNNSGEIIANDNNAIRIDKLDFTLNRQGVKNATIVKNDARYMIENNPRFVDYFDYIIADLPCSAEGKFNIHKEKSFGFWNESTNKKNYRLQKHILESSIQMLKIGGELIYSTCTISPEENEALVHTILCLYPNLELQDINLEYKYSRDGILEYGKQRYKKEVSKTKRILPSEESEGFFIAKFKRVS